MSRIEGGSRAPTLDTLERLSRALGVAVADLLRTPPPKPSKHPPAVRRVVAMLETEPAPVQQAVEEVVRSVMRAIRTSTAKG